eukprot:TRINITY_DN11998_c0_g1_i1.p1 TRINITY_DN11998_c0_g1~~TRINITY_DN11998_c0_g1_i1.p1  ORF type:complete len:306 (-),score=38.25 TRINITY_DN11998_c0_g1_i1:69-986(-)
MKLVNEQNLAYYTRSQPQPDRSDPLEIDRMNARRYKGSNPRKRVDNNPNYYDHNILGLENRLVKSTSSDAPWFTSVDSRVAGRKKSHDAGKVAVVGKERVVSGEESKLNLMHYGCSGIENDGVSSKGAIHNRSKSELYSDYALKARVLRGSKSPLKCDDCDGNTTVSVPKQNAEMAYDSVPAADRKGVIKKQLHELLAKQTVIKQQLENNKINKERYIKLLAEQNEIEQQRRILMKEYKALLNKIIETVKMPIRHYKRQSNAPKNASTLQTMRKAYYTNISEIEQQVNAVVMQRKVYFRIIYRKT